MISWAVIHSSCFMTSPGDGQNLGPGWCPAAPRPDLGKGRPWVTHECEELKKQIACGCFLSSYFAPGPAHAWLFPTLRFGKPCCRQPVSLAEPAGRAGPCLAARACAPLVLPKLPTSCRLRLLELQTLPVPKQLPTTLSAPPQNILWQVGCPGDSPWVHAGVGGCSWSGSPSPWGCRGRWL